VELNLLTPLQSTTTANVRLHEPSIPKCKHLPRKCRYVKSPRSTILARIFMHTSRGSDKTRRDVTRSCMNGRGTKTEHRTKTDATCQEISVMFIVTINFHHRSLP